MSKGRQLTKKKWKNGQRQKGAGKSPYAGDKGHHAPPWSSIKYPRGSKFLKCFDGKHYVELYIPARTCFVLKERVIFPGAGN